MNRDILRKLLFVAVTMLPYAVVANGLWGLWTVVRDAPSLAAGAWAAAMICSVVAWQLWRCRAFHRALTAAAG